MTITNLQGTVTLRNGITMPYLGLGVFQMSEGKETIEAVKHALEIGYRHIDTAALYGNERSVAQAIRESTVNRKDIFVTTKVWNSDQGYDNTLRAFDKSMKRLSFDVVDLYLVHWPVKGKYLQTWRALEKLYEEKRIRAIGLSNFLQHHIEDILAHCNEPPTVDQLEFHPYLVQQKLIDFCAAKHIQYESWSPLMRGRIFSIPEIQTLAKKYNKTAAQIVLRWNLQKGIVTIPKSSNKNRIAENAQVFDFEISAEDMKATDALDKHERIDADPDNFNF